LTNATLPQWLKEPEPVKDAARRAAKVCAERGVDIAKLALQFSTSNPEISTTIAGSANPENIRNWAKWIAEPLDRELLEEVRAIFAPMKNIGHLEGLPENN
jgi:L-galactose dehydrogenase